MWLLPKSFYPPISAPYSDGENRSYLPSSHRHHHNRRIPREFSSVRGLHSVHDLWLDTRHFSQRTGLQLRLRVPQRASRRQQLTGPIIPKRNPSGSIRIIRIGILKLLERLQQLIIRFRRERDSTTPNWALGEGLEIEPRHDTEVVLSAFQRNKEIGLGRCVCVDDFAACEDDFEIYD